MDAKRVLFHRAYHGFTGGHLKFWDYYNHVRDSPDFRALIAFSPDSVWDNSNPWMAERASALPEWRAEDADILFLAGTDWLVMDEGQREHPPRPVINFIQGVRHARPGDARHQFLRHPAIRICASDEIAAALRDLGTVRGPIHTIVYGLDQRSFPEPWPDHDRPLDLAIMGSKQPTMGPRVYEHFERLRQEGGLPPDTTIELVNSTIPRATFLEVLARARVTAFLPSWEEGFFLPALEAMALGTLVVCPDCVGNRSFCRPGENCLRPAYTEAALVAATEEALLMSPDRRDQFRVAARATALRHGMDAERERFLTILREAGETWRHIV